MNKLGSWGALVINALLLASVIAYLHLTSYLYECGLFEWFHLPKELIEVHYSSFINEIAPITISIFVIFIICIVIFPRLNRRSSNQLLVIVVGLLPGIIILLWPILIWQNNVLKWPIAAAFLIFWGGLFILAPIFNRNLKGNYRDKLYAQQISDAADITKLLILVGWIPETQAIENKSYSETIKADAYENGTISDPETKQLYDAMVKSAGLHIQGGMTMFEGFIKEIPKELVDNKYNLVQRAWDEAIRTNAHLITSEPIICVPREPMYPDNYDYFYYKRELYKVRKSISIDSANVKRNNAYRANVNSALNILIARDCKTDEEKKARIYSELINLAIDYRRPRSGNSFPVYKDQNNNLVPYECYKNANEFADSLYIKHNPVMQYVWDVATGKPIVDFNNLPLKIKLAIPTKFVTASPALNQKEINSIGITNNSTPRRIAIAIFSAFIIVLLPVLSHNHGMDIASHQVDFVTFYTLEDGGPYIAYRIYDSHVICTTIGVSRLDRTISVFTKASMKYIQIKAIGPLIY